MTPAAQRLAMAIDQGWKLTRKATKKKLAEFTGPDGSVFLVSQSGEWLGKRLPPDWGADLDAMNAAEDKLTPAEAGEYFRILSGLTGTWDGTINTWMGHAKADRRLKAYLMMRGLWTE